MRCAALPLFTTFVFASFTRTLDLLAVATRGVKTVNIYQQSLLVPSGAQFIGEFLGDNADNSKETLNINVAVHTPTMNTNSKSIIAVAVYLRKTEMQK